MARLIPGRLCRVALLLLCHALPAAGQEAWLVTYGPGKEVWERFGHNALWLRDTERDLDHVFSFGYFEIDEPGFHLDFARGRMRYFGSASTPEREFAFYRMRDRSIAIQRLNLDHRQIRQLHGLLYEAIFPIPQYYDYDYFFHNCSTWLRDLIDEVTGGGLRSQFEAWPARMNFRDHIRRLNEDRVGLHIGLNLLLGPEIDRPRSAWEEAFLPGALAHWVGRARVGGEPLVLESEQLYASVTHRRPDSPGGLWWFYGGLGLLSLALILMPLMLGNSFWPLLPWRLAVVVTGLGGLVIVLMWFGTAHDVIAGNAMVLMLNPAWLLVLLPLAGFAARLLWWLLLAGACAGAIVLGWPEGPQYRGELLAWLVPMLAGMFLLARWRPESGSAGAESISRPR
ncbi:MAG: DUF4105 domain-containing protein [Pseudomonadota bacterium]|nr:MAG: DUF4105 domain-containing protein [Pseudomonadota bacterium]